MMQRQHTTWIVTADGTHARIIKRNGREHGFEVIADMVAPEAHLLSHELGSDRPGRVHESANATSHAIQPRHDPHRKKMDAFLRSVATYLNDAETKKSYDALILFAAPHSLGELRQHLSATVNKKLKTAIAKDLNKLPLSELQEHLDALE